MPCWRVRWCAGQGEGRASAHRHLGHPGGGAAERRYCRGAGRACRGCVAGPGRARPVSLRPMRKAAGLPSPELKIGQAAHGFFSLACTCRELVLAAPNRRERAPAVPARWLTRLHAMLAGAELALPAHLTPRIGGTARPAGKPRAPPRPLSAPARRIPADQRSISDIGTLMADPYASMPGKSSSFANWTGSTRRAIRACSARSCMPGWRSSSRAARMASPGRMRWRA